MTHDNWLCHSLFRFCVIRVLGKIGFGNRFFIFANRFGDFRFFAIARRKWLESPPPPVNVDRQQFEEALQQHFATHPSTDQSKRWTRERLNRMVSLMKEYLLADPTRVHRTTEHYSKARSYDVMRKKDRDVLIMKRKSDSDPYIEILCVEDYYDILLSTHLKLNHAGRDKMKAYMSDRNDMKLWTISMFVKLCPSCQKTKHIRRKGLVVKPIISEQFQARGQIDLMDFQLDNDGPWKWVFHYQDHLTKFCFLAPLKRKSALEVAGRLKHVFNVIGAPLILQSDNGREFRNKVMSKLLSKWPRCKFVHGRPRYPQSQGSIERANGSVKKMIISYMQDYNTTHWARALEDIQWTRNNLWHRTIRRTPFEAVFGARPLCERGGGDDELADELSEDSK